MTAAWRRRSLLVAVGLLLVAVVGTAGWLQVTSRAASQVSSRWHLSCPGTRLDTGVVTTIHVRPGWRCTAALRVQNDSGRSVRLSRVDAPYTGPGNGLTLGHSTADAHFRPVPDDPDDPPEFLADAIDGEFVLDGSVPAHSARTVTLAIGEPRQLCMSAGTADVPDWPVVVLDVGHRTFRQPAGQELRLRYTHGLTRDCDQLDDRGLVSYVRSRK